MENVRDVWAPKEQQVQVHNALYTFLHQGIRKLASSNMQEGSKQEWCYR